MRGMQKGHRSFENGRSPGFLIAGGRHLSDMRHVRGAYQQRGVQRLREKAGDCICNKEER